MGVVSVLRVAIVCSVDVGLARLNHCVVFGTCQCHWDGCVDISPASRPDCVWDLLERSDEMFPCV